MTGTLHLVGVGPGDPELLTLKAARVIAAADVVAYPATGEDSALALDIARAHVQPTAEHLPVTIPMKLERGPAQAAYDAAAAAIARHLAAGRNVVWLCEGDPLFYGSAMYMLDRLAAVAPVVVIPGVTSLTAAAAAIPRPLAARNETLRVLPAPLPDDLLREELRRTEAAAIIKVGRHFQRVRALLDEAGLSSSAVIVEHATTARERVLPIGSFGADERPYFSTIFVYRGAEPWA